MNTSKRILSILEQSIDANDHCSLVVSGGSSLLSIFAALSTGEIPWKKVSITLADNRLVSSNSLDSNEHLIRDKLLINNARKANFLPLSEEIIERNSKILPFDIVLLGMGEDGHFASIFPDMVNDERFVDVSAQPAVYKISKRGKPFLPRITMNLALLTCTRNLFLVVSNEKKRRVLRKGKNTNSYPIFWLLNQKKTTVSIETFNNEGK